MKSLYILIILSGAINNLYSQMPNKNSIGSCFYFGNIIYEHVKNYNIEEIKKEFNNISKKDILVQIINSSCQKKDSILITPDMYFDSQKNAFIYSIITGKWIDDGTDWGLFDYLFIIELEIQYNTYNQTPEIVDKKIFDTNSDLETWWRTHNLTYKGDKYFRYTMHKKYNFAPTPPPPPKTNDWLE